jgi:hypothetical protein
MHLLCMSLSFVVLAGCAAPLAQFSRNPEPSKPVKVQFIGQGGAYSTLSLFAGAHECTGIQRLVWHVSGFDETIYVPKSRYITFLLALQLPGVARIKHAERTYSVPLNTDQLRVRVSYDSESLYAEIDGFDPKLGWKPVDGLIERRYRRPFADSGAWCDPVDSIE